MSRTRMTLLVIASLACLIAAEVLAVTPTTWSQATEADFSQGQFNSTLVTSRGEVMLAREISVLLKAEAAPASVSAVAIAGKIVYAGSGTSNDVYKIDGQKADKFAQVPGTMITSLLWTGQELLAGTGGQNAGVYRLDAQGKAKELWTDAKVKYVWAILAGPKGSVYAATGPQGAVYQIDAAGKAALIYQAPPKLAKNILCLAAAKDGMLYAGTDTSGLVIQIDAQAKTARVVLDADEKEVAAIVVDGATGNVYAATADVTKGSEGESQPGGERGGKSEPAGKPSLTTNPTSGPGGDESTAAAPSHVNAVSAADRIDEQSSEPAGGGEDESESPLAMHSGPGGQTAGEGESEGSSRGPGNSVYCIHKDGLVSTVFHRPVTILAMLIQDGKLVLGTGDNGTIYSVSTDGDDVVQLAKTEAKQITALAGDTNGDLYFGSSNNGSVGRIGQSLAKEGTFVSKPADAKQIAKWGTIQLAVKTPPGAGVTVATRTGNVAQPDDKTWGTWSKEQPASEAFLPIASPAGRYFQYRLTFAGDAKITAAVSSVSVVYQVGNLAPVIAGLVVTAGQGGQAGPTPGPRGKHAAPAPEGDEKGAKAVRTIAIRAADPNNDQLVYAVYFRQVGTANWIKIADKLTDPQYSWDTRTVGDGDYEVRVTASDSPSNPPSTALETARISGRVVVDNTPPVIKDLAAVPQGMKVSVTGTTVDANKIAAIYYSIDSQEDWVSVLPTDGICDSNKEAFSFVSKELTAGAHRVAVKVEDAFGNVGYSAVNVTLGK